MKFRLLTALVASAVACGALTACSDDEVGSSATGTATGTGGAGGSGGGATTVGSGGAATVGSGTGGSTSVLTGTASTSAGGQGGTGGAGGQGGAATATATVTSSTATGTATSSSTTTSSSSGGGDCTKCSDTLQGQEPKNFCPGSQEVFDELRACYCDPGGNCTALCQANACTTGEPDAACFNCILLTPEAQGGCKEKFDACVADA